MSNLDVTKKQYSKLKTMSKITKFRQRFATFKLQLISHNIHTFPELLIYLSCFIFYYKVIEYQTFRKMKHTTFMFHF